MKARPIQLREWSYLWRDENSHLYRYRGNRFFLTSNGRNWTQDPYSNSEKDIMANGYISISNEDAIAKIKVLMEKADKSPINAGLAMPHYIGEIKGVQNDFVGGNVIRLMDVKEIPKDYPVPPLPEPIEENAQPNVIQIHNGYSAPHGDSEQKFQSYTVDTESNGNEKITAEYVTLRKSKKINYFELPKRKSPLEIYSKKPDVPQIDE